MDRKIKWLIVVTIGSIFALGLIFILKERHLDRGRTLGINGLPDTTEH
ncbi:hypothetical protein [Natronincola ferrireducens]|uniref:Uncharacterized protein n=1 Tax=Natronincola ferrireducens TaxID=393762 RepID=A0A1G8Z7R4_9FIRM|nr:hypothetical protein [Natronincola ferrireducens]SDK11119.1 hypothetical protein SAMN05660472_00765 [Natronincola ferrireducens]